MKEEYDKVPKIPSDRPSFFEIDAEGNWREVEPIVVDLTGGPDCECRGCCDYFDLSSMAHSTEPLGGTWYGSSTGEDFATKEEGKDDR